MKPIETEYAGCRFRSRLEARWAVFFDQLGTKWQYEPQGYEFDGERYLPDFYLPQAEQYVEVKGNDDQLRVDYPRLRKFATNVDQDVVILGEIPRLSSGSEVPAHPMFTKLGGETVALIGIISGTGKTAPLLVPWPVEAMTTEAGSLPFLCAHPTLIRAYTAASAARFEHGESGAKKASEILAKWGAK